MQKNSSNKIDPPSENKAAAYSRAAMKGALGAIPIAGSAIAEAADAFAPDPNATDRKRWEIEITTGHNALTERVDAALVETGTVQEVSLTGITAAIAKSMIETCPDGLGITSKSLSEILEDYGEFDRGEALDAVGFLESHGLVETIPLFGSNDLYRLTGAGYEALDLSIMGWSPVDDAKTLAGMLENAREGVDVCDLFSRAGWQKRRFNPALQILVDFVGYERVSRECQMEFVTNWFLPNNSELARIRQFAGLTNS